MHTTIILFLTFQNDLHVLFLGRIWLNIFFGKILDIILDNRNKFSEAIFDHF